MSNLESRSPDTPSVHHEHCDAVLTASDLVAGITNKPCNCDAVGARQSPDTPDVSEAAKISPDLWEVIDAYCDACMRYAVTPTTTRAKKLKDADDAMRAALSQSTTDTQRLKRAIVSLDDKATTWGMLEGHTQNCEECGGGRYCEIGDKWFRRIVTTPSPNLPFREIMQWRKEFPEFAAAASSPERPNG